MKGQERWIDRQISASRSPPNAQIEEYFEKYKPDIVMFLETPFSDYVYHCAKKHGAKTVAIPMHETNTSKRLGEADLMICTCKEAWRKSTHGNKRLLFLPIGLGLFEYRERTGHTFVANLGYGGVNDRRQSAKIVKAFEQVRDSKARLIIRCQQKFPKGCESNDGRIKFINKNYAHPADIYKDGDISILPIAYGGYERSILESMASGMPTLTMDADPMNLFQHDPDLLVEPSRQYEFSEKWVLDTIYNEVSVEALRAKMEWLLTIDTAKYSRRARQQAKAQSWESEDINYKTAWMEAFESTWI